MLITKYLNSNFDIVNRSSMVVDNDGSILAKHLKFFLLVFSYNGLLQLVFICKCYGNLDCSCQQEFLLECHRHELIPKFNSNAVQVSGSD